MAGRGDQELAALEREARAGSADAEGLARLGQSYLRLGRVEDARRTFEAAKAKLPSSLVHGDDGVELATLWDELIDLIATCEARLADAQKGARREELVARLAHGALPVAEHDELVRLELALGLQLHVQPAVCPACRGPLVADAVGLGVRCARTGVEGDLCRHMDADDLFRCGCCGLVVRAWSRESQGRPVAQPGEPPVGLLRRSRCEACGGPVQNWANHVRHCPKAKTADFPRCTSCHQRGHHARVVDCPRCRTEVTKVTCLERQKRGVP